MRSSPNTHLMTHRIPFDTLCPGQAGLGPPNQRPPNLSVLTFVKYIGLTPESPESMGKGQDYGQYQGKPEQIRDDSLSKHV